MDKKLRLKSSKQNQHVQLCNQKFNVVHSAVQWLTYHAHLRNKTNFSTAQEQFCLDDLPEATDDSYREMNLSARVRLHRLNDHGSSISAIVQLSLTSLCQSCLRLTAKNIKFLKSLARNIYSGLPYKYHASSTPKFRPEGTKHTSTNDHYVYAASRSDWQAQAQCSQPVQCPFVSYSLVCYQTCKHYILKTN